MCARCWRDLFDTKAFEECCAHGPPSSGREDRCVRTEATIGEIRDAHCTWCAYIRGFVNDSWNSEEVVSIYLAPSSISSCTPKGGNVFYLSIDCHSPAGKWIGGSHLFLHAWTSSEDSASECVTARPLRTDVDSEAAKTQLRTWSDECSGHERCSASPRDSNLPTRVIEISPPGRQHPRILESRNLCGVYATLSYCWGQTPFSTLTRSNYGKLIEELDLSNLPLTFRHAVSTTQNLSIRYLWIDALCIIQDSEEDKLWEMARMKDIYASSALTIVAASAKSASEGFLHPRVHSEPFETIPVRIRPGHFGTMSVNELDAAGYDERLEPLAKRAWCLQEQLLAQRTLTFTTRTMMWRCQAGTRNFGDSLHFPHDLDSGYNDQDEKYSLNLHSLLLREEEAGSEKHKTLSCWLRLVTAYSLRVASLECDKLNAVAGVASHPSFSRALGPGYYAGLWQYELASQLTWRVSRFHRTLPASNGSEGAIVQRPATYRAPTWSWASVEGGVIYFTFSFDRENEDYDNPDVVCDIIDCSTTPTSPELNPFGEVMSAQLRLRAAIRRAWFDPSGKNVFLVPTANCAESSTAIPPGQELITFAEARIRHVDAFKAKCPNINLDEEPDAPYRTDAYNICGICDESRVHEPVQVLLAAITSDQHRDTGIDGLMLVLNEVKNGNNIFRRIGFFEEGRSEEFPKETKTDIYIV